MSGGGFERTTVDGETRFEWHGGGLFIGVIVGLLYYALLNGGSKGQTIGKMAMRIQVRDIDTGGPIGVGRGFGRQLMIYLFTFACVLPLLLDYLSPVVGPAPSGVARQGRAQRRRGRRVATSASTDVV